MSLGIEMSFSMKRATWKSALFVIVFATIGFLVPATYLAWWGLFGGRELEIQRNIQRLTQQNPTSQAASAIINRDYRLYTTGGPLDPQAPGVGRTDERYKETFGYRGFTTFEGDPLSPERSRLNAAAIRYMAEYNQIIFSEVNRTHPDWLTQYEEKKRRNVAQ